MRGIYRARKVWPHHQKEVAAEGRISTTTSNPCEANTCKISPQTGNRNHCDDRKMSRRAPWAGGAR